MATVDVAARLADRFGSRVRRDVPLGPHTTYRVGGPARLALEVLDEAELLVAAEAIAGAALATLVVGKGSNLLVSDRGFDGLALFLGGSFDGISFDGAASHGAGAAGGACRAGGAASLPVVARRAAHRGLAGFEWAVGVPGTIGGAVRMNAGGHGSDMAASVRTVRVVDLATATAADWSPGELAFGYRRSALSAHHVVVAAELALQPGDPAESLALVEQIVAWRRAHQPGGPNAGSVFTNPPGDSAGRLIDAAGGKGLRVGTAEVSTKHANFIQADAGGRAEDVWRLMAAVRQLVVAAGGPVLQPETHLVGFEGPLR